MLNFLYTALHADLRCRSQTNFVLPNICGKQADFRKKFEIFLTTQNWLTLRWVEFLNLKFEYLRDSESLSKTFLACLSGDHVGLKNHEKIA